MSTGPHTQPIPVFSCHVAASRGVQVPLTLIKLVAVLVVAGVLGAGFLIPYVAGIGAAANAGTNKFLNTTCDLKETQLQQTTKIVARDGTPIATLFAYNRQTVSLGQVPKTTQQALIDTEDRRFYSHHGVDPRGLLRAALNESNGATQGASTITQQYVKQVRYYQAKTDAERQAAIDQTLDRKIYEARCALALEKKYTKAQILEKYFNIAYFGEQSYGIQVAAETYFGVNSSQLTVPQSAVLVGLVKDPTLYDPFQNYKAAKQRRDEVIDNMVAVGDLSAAKAAAYKKTPITLATKAAPTPEQGCAFSDDKAIANVGFFCDYVVNWLTTTGGLTLDAIDNDGLTIRTSIDPALQNKAQKSLFRDFTASSPTTAAIPAIDPRNGEIMSMATSKLYNYGNAHPNNRRYTSIPVFTKPVAGSGSTYKYFSTIAALTAGMQTTQQLTTAGAFPQRYFPRNCGEDRSVESNGIANAGNYRPTLSLRDALVQSSNTYFVGLEDQFFNCDLSTIVKTAQNLGMNALNAKESNGKTIAQNRVDNNSYTFTIGQESTSPLELTSAYSAAANDGVLCSPRPVLSITGPDKKPVAFKQATCERKMSQWVARTAIDMMEGDTEYGGGGTANSQFSSFYNQYGETNHLVAAKTGTNNASYQSGPQRGQDNGQNSALWFVGMTPTLTAASAVFNFTNPTQTVDIPGLGQNTSDTFGAYSATLWINALGSYVGSKSWDWRQPDSIDGAQQVPSVVGQTPADAIPQLTALGFKPVEYPIECGSNLPPGVIAYNGPGYAVPNSSKSTVYYCVSNGKQLVTPPPPVIKHTKTKTPTGGNTPTTGPTTKPTGRGHGRHGG